MNQFKRFATAAALIAASSLCPAPLAVFAQSSSPHAISLYNLGLTAYKQGSPESAIIFFKRACDIDPDLADAQYNLGVLFQSQKRCKEAIPRFQEVLRVKPNDPDAHYQLALCLADVGQTQDARQHLAAIPPNHTHFGDAQNRMRMIDSGITTPPIASPPVLPIAPPVSQAPATPTDSPPAFTYPPPGQTPAVPQQPPSVQPQQPIAIAPPAATVKPPNNLNAPPATAGPVPLLANASVRVIATGFSAPAGLAFDKSGNLYVANFLNNTVDRISADGSRSQFSSGSNLKGPIGLAVDSLGNVYVANYIAGTVARISPAGISTIIASGFKKPYYLTLDREGNLFVSQQEDNSIARISLPRSTVGAKP